MDNYRYMFANWNDSSGGLAGFEVILPAIAKKIYKVPSVKKLYEKRKEFDLVVIDHLFNEVSVGP